MRKRFGHAHSPPCNAARRGGRAITKRSRSLLNREAGVVFRLKTKGKPPRLRPLSRLRAVLSVGAATPPCRDARRGISHSEPFRHFFQSSYDRPYNLQAHSVFFRIRFNLTAIFHATIGELSPTDYEPIAMMVNPIEMMMVWPGTVSNCGPEFGRLQRSFSFDI